MALRIRLARGGSVHDAHYKVVVIESTKQRDGQAVDIIGHYHPNFHNEKRLQIDVEKLSKWLGFGAKPTDVIVRLGLNQGIKMFEKFSVKHIQGKNYGKSKKEIKAQNSAS
jgi:small subunit ribosomal protein S16